MRQIKYFLFETWVLTIAVFMYVYAAAVTAYEETPQIHITEIIPPAIAQSVSHRVEDARLTGNYIEFRVESDVGSFNIESLPLLITRVREISILNQARNQMSRQWERPADYSRGKYQVSADSALDILARPMSTASNMADQVRKNLENTQDSPGEKYTGFNTSDMESEDPVIAMHKRNIASQWGLDVYSSNPDVQIFLSDAAMARSAGKIATGAPVMTNRNAMPLKIVNKDLEYEIRTLIKNNSLSDLDDINNKLLSGMNLNLLLVSEFLQHRIYSPRHKTVITQYLMLLKNVANRMAFLELAVKADSEKSALGFEIACKMLVYYHENIKSLQKLYSGNGVLQAIAMDNSMVFFSTADIIYWSRNTEETYDRLIQQAESAGFGDKELITTGEITDEAYTRLTEKGFVLKKKIIF